MHSTVTRFPRRIEAPAPTTGTPSRWWRTKWAARSLLGRTLNRLGVPSAISPFEHVDAATGETLRVEVGEHLTCLTVGGRDYYFDRITGRLDGTGLGCNR